MMKKNPSNRSMTVQSNTGSRRGGKMSSFPTRDHPEDAGRTWRPKYVDKPADVGTVKKGGKR